MDVPPFTAGSWVGAALGRGAEVSRHPSVKSKIPQMVVITVLNI